jgi:glycosyltransferase involved in cell wall biosynthesis
VAPFLDRFEVLWVTTEPLPPEWLARHPGLRQARLPRPLLRRLPRRLFLHTADYLLEVSDLILRRFRPDLVHVHYLSQLDALALYPHRRRVPLVVSLMGADVLEDQVPRPLGLDLVVRAVLRRAGAVTAKSEFLAERARALGAWPERVHRVPWGVDLARFRALDRAEARARLGLPADAQVLLSSRALQPLYNHLPLLEAVAALAARPLLVFTRAAEAPAHAEEVAARARALGLATRVLPAQAPEDMPWLYAAADAVASLPASDGLPQTLLEALACARPVLALDLPAYAELPFPADALARVAQRGGRPDPDALRGALDLVLAARARPGLAEARAWIEREASFAASVARVGELYERLLHPSAT